MRWESLSVGSRRPPTRRSEYSLRPFPLVKRHSRLWLPAARPVLHPPHSTPTPPSSSLSPKSGLARNPPLKRSLCMNLASRCLFQPLTTPLSALRPTRQSDRVSDTPPCDFFLQSGFCNHNSLTWLLPLAPRCKFLKDSCFWPCKWASSLQGSLWLNSLYILIFGNIRNVKYLHSVIVNFFFSVIHLKTNRP